jgi:hypothetical protein
MPTLQVKPKPAQVCIQGEVCKLVRGSVYKGGGMTFYSGSKLMLTICNQLETKPSYSAYSKLKFLHRLREMVLGKCDFKYPPEIWLDSRSRNKLSRYEFRLSKCEFLLKIIAEGICKKYHLSEALGVIKYQDNDACIGLFRGLFKLLYPHSFDRIEFVLYNGTNKKATICAESKDPNLPLVLTLQAHPRFVEVCFVNPKPATP